MYRYDIYIDPVNYVANLIVNDAKIVWEKDDNGIIFRKRPDGKFSLNRTGNELLFDKLMLFTFCEKGILSVYDGNGLIAQGTFGKKSLTISEDKCRIDIKFEKYDEYNCLDKIADKDFNILATSTDYPYIPVHEIKLEYGKLYEYVTCYDYICQQSDFTGNSWTNFTDITGAPYPQTSCFPSGSFLTFFSNRYTLDGDYIQGGTNCFNVISTWVQEIKLLPRLGGVQSDTPSNDPLVLCDKWGWNFSTIVQINGVQYDKFVRFANITGNFSAVIPDGGLQLMSPYVVKTELSCTDIIYSFDRCRKLNDVINSMIYECFDNGFKSDFFKNTVNPISGADLSNLMISQKSDCIGTTSDPAHIGILTFKTLMEHLNSMFNVKFGIDVNGDFRIEHKYYWDNNCSYDNYPFGSNTVEIDLTLVYPYSLIGTNEYTFESTIPIRETFKFMEAWNVDFIGTDIDYSECINKGDNITYSASMFTTDVDPSYLDVFASKDGFCIFHCDSKLASDGFYHVLGEVGKLSNTSVKNAHLSWANLHDNYWKYDRYLPEGKMNGKQTEFNVRPLKYQKAISFPYCVSEFNPKKLIKTNLGNGIVRSASFSFKTNFITVELEYIDNI